MAPPSTQKAFFKPIAFMLDPGGSEDVEYVNLYIRPEDLSYPEPSRITTHQTLGKAWVDNYGEGLKRLTISGNTGWRGEGLIMVEDGIERFQILRQVVFEKWHQLRQTKLENGDDPNDVKLIYADKLNDICCTVVPISFTLKRSKSRPLLMMYNIVMDVVDADASDAYISMLDTALIVDEIAALDSFGASINNLGDFAKNLNLMTGIAAVSSMVKFVGMTKKVMETVSDAYKSGGIVNAVLKTSAIGISGVGVNVCRSLCQMVGLPQDTLHNLMWGASVYGNMLCILKNAFRSDLMYPDYSDIYGASFCSSTVGGRPMTPLAGQNPFSLISPETSLPISISQDAMSAMSAMQSIDPVLTSVSVGKIENALDRIVEGVVV